jgi:hypothetical protein
MKRSMLLKMTVTHFTFQSVVTIIYVFDCKVWGMELMKSIDEFVEDGAQLIRSHNKSDAHTQNESEGPRANKLKARGPINLLRTMPKASVTLCLR